jgi:hypothetical protein
MVVSNFAKSVASLNNPYNWLRSKKLRQIEGLSASFR